MERKSHGKIGYYVTEKKDQKMNWSEFGNVCRKHNFTLVKLDLTSALEEQGPFFAIIHKMTDLIVKASNGDSEATLIMERVDNYIRKNPDMLVIDSLNSVQALMDRSRYYGIVQNSDLAQDKVFTPTFVELTSTNVAENIRRLKDAGVSYPFVCKPTVAHGSGAHQMAVVFNEEGVADCRPPCVAQSFINHNAVLYKIFIVGDVFQVSERPSLKNFYASDQRTIFFSTSDVSKIDSASSLTVLDPEDVAAAPPSQPDNLRLQHIVYTLRKELGMMLFGVDVVIENGSGRYGIIDINIFPGYESFSHFFETLMNFLLDASSSSSSCIRHQEPTGLCDGESISVGFEKKNSSSQQVHDSPHVQCTKLERTQSTSQESASCDQDDSGFDTGDSSDERKKKWRMARCRGGQSKKVTTVKNTSMRNSGKSVSRTGKDEGLGEV